MILHRKMIAFGLVSLFAVTMAGCENTWHGVKKDTGENLESSGKAIEEAGQKVEP
jgi:predicted small secreted protein